MQSMKSKAVPFLLATGLALSLAPPVVVRAERLPITSYTIADGLAHERVKCVFQDSQGFLWFCTSNGLNRYDGYRFATYRTEHGLPHVSINDMLETRSGEYWIATNGGGVARFHPDGTLDSDSPLFTAYSLIEEGTTGAAADDLRGTAGPRPNRVNVLYEDRRRQLWAGTDDGLFRLDTTNHSPTFKRVELDYPLVSGQFLAIWTLIGDDEGNLWLGTSRGLTRRYPDGRTAHHSVTPDKDNLSVRALLVEDGRLWIGHEAGLTIVYPEPASMSDSDAPLPWRRLLSDRSTLPSTPGDAIWVTRADGLVDEHVRTMYQTSDGRIWLGSNGGGWIGFGGGGLTEFDGKTFKSYTPADGLADDMIVDLAEGRDGNLWVGTGSRGAMKISTHGFTSYGEMDGVSHTVVRSIFEDGNGSMYAVGDRPFIDRLDDGRFTRIEPVLPVTPTETLVWSYSVVQDRTGQWWIGTREGLYRFAKTYSIDELARERATTVYTTRDGLAGNRILNLHEDSRGDIWFGTEGRDVLSRWERSTGLFHHYSAQNGLPASQPYAYAEDRSGNLWIGFDRGGVVRYRDGRFVTVPDLPGASTSRVSGLYLDHAGRIWILTSVSGVTRVDDPDADRPAFVTYTSAQGLSGCEATSITEDAYGRVYVAGFCGVNRIDPVTDRIKHYTTADGLGSNEVESAFRDSRDTLWFGTKRGVSRLIPREEPPEQPPPILIRGLRISGQRYPVSELGDAVIGEIQLGPAQNHIEIDFVGLSFALGRQLRYEYILEGTDTDWNEPTDQNSIIYGSLSPGRYRFQVRARDSDGLMSATPAVMAFTILPPLWQRGWFLSLEVLVIASLAYGLYRYRLEQLLHVERMRTRIAADLHDDIGAGLSRIVLLSEVLRREEGSNERGSEKLTKIADTGRELVDSMADIVWSMNPLRDDLRSLVLRIRQFASDLLEIKGIEWEFRSPETLDDVKLSPDVRRHVLSIFKEALNNIVRHADCRSAALDLKMTDGSLEAEIRDDGRGFVTSEKDSTWRRTGSGLINMQRRAIELGGELKIDSSPGRGTRITMSVPLR